MPTILQINYKLSGSVPVSFKDSNPVAMRWRPFQVSLENLAHERSRTRVWRDLSIRRLKRIRGRLEGPIMAGLKANPAIPRLGKRMIRNGDKIEIYQAADAKPFGRWNPDKNLNSLPLRLNSGALDE